VGRQENHGEIKEADWFSKFLLCHEKIPSFMGGKSKKMQDYEWKKVFVFSTRVRR